MTITVFFKDGSKQVMHPKTTGEDNFKGDPKALAYDLFGAKVLSVSVSN